MIKYKLRQHWQPHPKWLLETSAIYLYLYLFIYWLCTFWLRDQRQITSEKARKEVQNGGGRAGVKSAFYIMVVGSMWFLQVFTQSARKFNNPNCCASRLRKEGIENNSLSVCIRNSL